jgi:Kef-type K+ transport system membrane component KefB/nucleotide-binding universal stress UspA family protein
VSVLSSFALFPLSDPGAVFAVLFLLVLLGPLFAERARLPAIAGLILAGMLVGPNVLGVLARDTFIETLGYVGLLYLMFQGGLDLDMDGFHRRRADSLLFGSLTFAIPMVGVIAVARAVGLDLIPAVIVGTALASHTLLAYPVVSRYQLARTRGMTATLGATLVGNVAAFLVLAVAVAAVRQSGLLLWVRFGVGFAAYVFAVLVLVPRLTRWFFTGLGQDRQVRLTYLLSGMGIAALVARLVGIEPIVGAFLIGLAFNRFVPARTVIADRIQVLGSAVFIPAFLISTGMLLDPLAMVTDPTTILFGVLFLAVTAATKFVAAELAGRWMHLVAAERHLMFSLSVGQAAGALAAVIVAQDLGLVGPAVVNAIILVILGSALLAGFTGERSAPRVPQPERVEEPLGTRVVVPVSNPHTVGPLVRVAAQVAAPDSGAVVAINVLPLDSTQGELRAHRQLADEAERVALAAGAEVETSVRIDTSPSGGVLHTLVEREGTCLVMGWKGYANARAGLFGTVIDQVAAGSPVPVLVCRPGEDLPTGRIVIVVTAEDLMPAGERGTRLAFEVASRMARQAEVERVVVTDLDATSLRPRIAGFRIRPDVEIVGVTDLAHHLIDVLQPGDVVLTGVPPTAEGLRRDAQRLVRSVPDHTVVVVIPR